MKKRVLSALLVLCMACSMVSTVWAEGTNATSGAPEPASQTLNLDNGQPGDENGADSTGASSDSTDSTSASSDSTSSGSSSAASDATSDATSGEGDESAASSEVVGSEGTSTPSPTPTLQPESTEEPAVTPSPEPTSSVELEPSQVPSAASNAVLAAPSVRASVINNTVDTSEDVKITLYDYDKDINNGVNDTTGLMFYGQSGKEVTKVDSPAKSTNDKNHNNSLWWNLWTGNPGTEKYSDQGGGVNQGIVQDTLSEDGYPVLAVGKQGTLGYLFSDSDHTTEYAGLNKLFIKDENGNYSYDSSKNFATINPNGNGPYGSNFTVYNQENTGTATSTADGTVYFLPFNQFGTNEDQANYHFGMRIETDFLMPKEGKVNNQDMVFSFAGDDDVWVYIDGVLVLDMGGIHNSSTGTINFANGTVTIDKVTTIEWVAGSWGQQGGYYFRTDSKTEYIGDILHEAKADDPDWISANLEQRNVDNEQHWFLKDYTNHSLDFFYLERGAGGSNCKIEFNLYTLKQNAIYVGKQLAIADNAESTQDITQYLNNIEYKFRVLKENKDALFIAAGTEYDIIDAETQEMIGKGTVDENGIFTVKAGQYAVFDGITEDKGKYRVQELMEEGYSAQFGEVEVTVEADGGKQGFVDGQGGTIDDVKFDGVTTKPQDIAEQSGVVIFTNKVDIEKVSTLSIGKEAAPGSTFGDEQTFTMKVTMGGAPVPVGTPYQLFTGDSESGETTAVATEGELTLKPGQRAVFTVLTGTTFTVEEVNGSTYHVAYSATQEIGGYSYPYNLQESENGLAVSGTVGDVTGTGQTDGTNASMAVTVTNSSYDFNTSLRISKTLTGYENGTYSFDFKVTEVNKDGSPIETPSQNVTPVGAEITVSSPAATQGTVYFGFKSTVADRNYYFKLSEEQGSAEGVTYDDSYYLVTVEVENGTAAVTDVKKYNDNEVDASYQWSDGENVPSFTNSLGKDLTIIKVVEGVDSEDVTNKTFTFTLQGPVAVAGETYNLQGDGTVTFNKPESGKMPTATVSVTGAGSVTIKGLPDGVYTVTDETGDLGDVGDNYYSGFEVDPVTLGTSTTNNLTVTNVYKHYKSLTIKKDVTGAMSTDTDEFEFTVTKTSGTLSNGDITEAMGNTGVVDNSIQFIPGQNGEKDKITFKLKKNGEVVLSNLKDTDIITITETNPGNGYTLKTLTVPQQTVGEDGEKGDAHGFRKTSNTVTVTMEDVTLPDDNLGTVVFLNERLAVAPTGLESNHTTPYVLMITAAGMAGLALIGGIVTRRIRRRRQE